MPSKLARSLGGVHVWYWREEAGISIYTLGTRKIKAQALSSECDLENGAEDGEPRLGIGYRDRPYYSLYGAGTLVTKIINAIIDDTKRWRLNPNLVLCICALFLCHYVV
jgi:hypothetical protein